MSSYAAATDAIARIVEGGGEADEVLRDVVRALVEAVDQYVWAGIYFVENGELALGPWQGSGRAVQGRIPIGRGVCGGVAARGETRVVDEVAADAAGVPGTTGAEIAVPITWQGSVIGVIDVATAGSARLTSDDRAFLELVAERISPHCLVGWDTGGLPWDEVS